MTTLYVVCEKVYLSRLNSWLKSEMKKEGNVGAELKGIKRRNEDHAGSVTQSESVAVPKKKPERDTSTDDNTTINDVKLSSM